MKFLIDEFRHPVPPVVPVYKTCAIRIQIVYYAPRANQQKPWGGILQTFDYIIVGAGSSGCVIANRLTADGKSRVLLIEAGGAFTDPMMLMPKGFAKLMNDKRRAWRFAAERTIGNDPPVTEYWLRGKALGGSSSINGMVYSRGHFQDYEDWRPLAGDKWGWDAMKAAFVAIEDHELPATDFRGNGGPLKITTGKFRYDLAEKFIEAGGQMGLRRLEDINEPDHEGIGYYNFTIDRGRRWSSARAFLEPAMQRKNLTVVTNVEGDRILFDGRRATGIEGRSEGKPVSFHCASEVILCAGAINSPRLLQQSGVGPGYRLQAAGVDVVVDSPDVGERMREHLGFAMPHRLKNARGLNWRLRGLGLMASVAQYYLFHTGIMASGPYEIGAFARTDPSLSRPDIQVYVSALSTGRSPDGLPPSSVSVADEPGLTISCHAMRLTSESQLWITSPDPTQPAHIRANWLATEYDRKTMLGMVRFMRRFMTMPAIAPYVGEELVPGPAVQSDEDMMDAIKRLLTCAIHATGTCRMGLDDRSVVDPHLKVRGLANVRVVDCSVMPAIVSGNTNGPAIALAWRAADLWQEERRNAA
jgi:choline dehydrogenase-like flavoprotein